MKYIQTPEGRLIPNGNGYDYEYFLTDNLGNIRVVFGKNAQGQVEVKQEDHYYPYGMVMNGQSFSNTATPNKFLYNGKEYDANTGFYQYGFRQYDAAIGRWHVVDAMAGEYLSSSPYAYCLGNPVYYYDVMGLNAASDAITRLLNSQFGGSWSASGGLNFYSSNDEAINEGAIALYESGYSGGAGNLISTITVTGSAKGFLQGKYDSFFVKQDSRSLAWNEIDFIWNFWGSKDNYINGKLLKQVTSNTLIEYTWGSNDSPEYKFIYPQNLGKWGEPGSDGLIWKGCMSCHSPNGAYNYAAYNSRERLRGRVIAEIAVMFGSGFLIPVGAAEEGAITDVDGFISSQTERLYQKLGAKIGEGRLPFANGKKGVLDAIESVRSTLANPTKTTGIIPKSTVRGNFDLIHIYSSTTGNTVSLRVLGNGL